MSTVSSLSSRESLPACMPEPNPAASRASIRETGAAKPVTSSQTSVEEYRENDRNQGVVGKALERFYAESLSAIPPGGKLEVALQGQVRLEAAGELKLKAEVERGEDGTYQMTVRSGVGVGMAGSAGTHGPKGSAMLGIQGGVTLTFGSAAEAADRMAALAQSEVLSFTGLAGQAAAKLGVLDSDSVERAVQIQKNVKSFEVGLYAEMKGELHATAVKAGASLSGEGNFRVDVKEGKLTYETSAQVKLEGELDKGALEGFGAGLEGRLTLRAEVSLTQEEITRLKQGKLKPQELMKPERIHKSLTQEVKGELSKEGDHDKGEIGKKAISISAKRELPVEALGDMTRVLDPRGDWEVSAMRKRSLEGGGDLDLSAFELKAEGSIEVPIFDKPRKLQLGEVKDAVGRAQVQAESSEQLLLARRAMGR